MIIFNLQLKVMRILLVLLLLVSLTSVRSQVYEVGGLEIAAIKPTKVNYSLTISDSTVNIFDIDKNVPFRLYRIVSVSILKDKYTLTDNVDTFIMSINKNYLKRKVDKIEYPSIIDIVKTGQRNGLIYHSKLKE